MARKKTTVPASAIAAAIKAPVALTARGVRDLAPEAAAHQLALYEAALEGDTAKFEKIRDAG